MSELRRFIFDGMPARGLLVRLTDAWQELLARRGQPEQEIQAGQLATRLLGELTAAALLLQASIKFDGTLILQIFGDGPLKLAVAEVQADLALRSMLKFDGPVPAQANLTQLLNRTGQGRCAVTLDPGRAQSGREPYQGIVSLEAGEGVENLAQVIARYMRQSEQVDSVLVLAANDEIAAGLLLQRLPLQGQANLEGAKQVGEEAAAEDYRRLALLAASLQPQELLSLDSTSLLRRLFWQEPCRVLESDSRLPHFACSCSRERVSAMLQGLGAQEAEDILKERGSIEVGCEFCGKKYRYDAIDAAQIFRPESDRPPSSEAVQ